MALGRKLDPKVAEEIAADMEAIDNPAHLPKPPEKPPLPHYKGSKPCPDCDGGLADGQICTTCAGSGIV